MHHLRPEPRAQPGAHAHVCQARRPGPMPCTAMHPCLPSAFGLERRPPVTGRAASCTADTRSAPHSGQLALHCGPCHILAASRAAAGGFRCRTCWQMASSSRAGSSTQLQAQHLLAEGGRHRGVRLRHRQRVLVAPALHEPARPVVPVRQHARHHILQQAQQLSGSTPVDHCCLGEEHLCREHGGTRMASSRVVRCASKPPGPDRACVPPLTCAAQPCASAHAGCWACCS